MKSSYLLIVMEGDNTKPYDYDDGIVQSLSIFLLNIFARVKKKMYFCMLFDA